MLRVRHLQDGGRGMTTITRENFTAAMEQAVAERGEDYVYPDEWRDGHEACQYAVAPPQGPYTAVLSAGTDWRL